METPKDWKDITVAQYYNLLEAIEMDFDDDLDKSVAMLSALTNISIKDLEEKIPIRELTRGLKEIAFIGKGKPEVNLTPRIKLNGKKYEFDMILRDSVAGSFIDLAELAKEPKRNMHKVLAIFLHELDWKGSRKPKTIKDQIQMANIIEQNLTMDLAFGYSDFFLNSWERLQQGTLDYLEKQKKKSQKILKRELMELHNS